jgi:hypothetical protein
MPQSQEEFTFRPRVGCLDESSEIRGLPTAIRTELLVPPGRVETEEQYGSSAEDSHQYCKFRLSHRAIY